MAKCKQDNCDPWKKIKGPASGCIATLGRIGWDVPMTNGWKIWYDSRGREIDLTEISPHALKQIIHKDVTIVNWKQSILNEVVSDDSGIWLEPLRSVVLGKDTELCAMARSAAISTQWTQDRVANAGYAPKDDNKCRL